MPTKRSIWVRFSKEGIHRYPLAATELRLAEVSFLSHPHRHIFHFRVEIEVFHDDRDIEFILFKRELERLYGEGTLSLDYKSCEMLANDLLDYIIKQYAGRFIIIEVSEDNENGCRIEFN